MKMRSTALMHTAKTGYIDPVGQLIPRIIAAPRKEGETSVDGHGINTVPGYKQFDVRKIV